MKRTLLTIFILVILLLSFSVLFACKSKNDEKEEVILEYTGTPISKIAYGIEGFTAGEYIDTIDFENNNITLESFRGYGEQKTSTKTTVATFNSEDEKVLINRLYTYGLFDLQERYTTEDVVLDGISWSLVITYEDGSVKKSGGYAAAPGEVFNKCAIAIYDASHYEFWYVPTAYKVPPRVDLSNNLDSAAKLYKCQWHATTIDNGDLYQFASTLESVNTKNVIIGTQNYYNWNGSEYVEKFSRCVVKEYDNNPELTNEKVILDTGWIKSNKSKKFNVQQNKIYTIELTFSNNQYSIVVFITKQQ